MMYDNCQMLYVDLETETCFRTPLPGDPSQWFIGGRGFNVWYLFHYLPRGIDPLGPENLLLFSCGLLTGTAAPAASRLHVNALSPLTGILGSSNVGGYVGPWIRSCGVHSIIIRGQASRPVYLYIDETTAEVRPASKFWGLDAFETQDRLIADLGGRQIKVLTIGPAGETGARFACIMTERDHAAGRTGMGAVMGSKHLKAIAVVRGTGKPFEERSPAAKEAVKAYAREIMASADYDIFSRYGGAGYLKWADDMGVMGTRNYREIRFKGVGKLDGRHLKEKVVRSSGCFRCPIQCKAELSFGKGRERATRPEFEPMINLGAKCGLDDLEAVVRLDNLCSRLGLDSTSTATAIAFAMDLYDRGILIASEVGGLDLSWGNSETMETLIRQMAAGRGLGGCLAQGVKRAAASIGRGAEQYAAHVKGLELTAYHPGTILGTALGYMVSSRGGDYNNVYASLEHNWSPEKAESEFGTARAVDIHSPEGKGPLVRRAVLVNIVVDCFGICKVPALSLLKNFDLEREARLATAITGYGFTAEGLLEKGGKIAAMERLFNLIHGPADFDDRLPPMFLKGDAKQLLTAADLRRMRQEFYQAMGWDARGRPTPETLETMGLEPIVFPERSPAESYHVDPHVTNPHTRKDYWI